MRPLLDWIKGHPELASLAGAWIVLSIVNALTPHWTTKHPTWKRLVLRGLEWLAWFPSLRAAAGRGPLFWLKLPLQDIAPATKPDALPGTLPKGPARLLVLLLLPAALQGCAFLRAGETTQGLETAYRALLKLDETVTPRFDAECRQTALACPQASAVDRSCKPLLACQARRRTWAKLISGGLFLVSDGLVAQAAAKQDTARAKAGELLALLGQLQAQARTLGVMP